MNIAFAKAFETWENEFRTNPEKFMTASEVAAADLLTLADQRAVYFEAILRTLAVNQPTDGNG